MISEAAVMMKPVWRPLPSFLLSSDAAQGAVVHVDGAGLGDALGIEMQVVAVEKLRIDQRREQFVKDRHLWRHLSFQRRGQATARAR